MKQGRVFNLVELGMLTAMMTILGMIKLPNILPGIEFQLSAPLAVAICVVFGFKKYIICGCLSSIIGLALGMQNIVSVAIALQFRLIVGLLLYVGHNHLWSIIVSGPIASCIARITLGFYFGKLVTAMILMAVPGMIFTMVMSPIFVKAFKKIKKMAMKSGSSKLRGVL